MDRRKLGLAGAIFAAAIAAGAVLRCKPEPERAPRRALPVVAAPQRATHTDDAAIDGAVSAPARVTLVPRMPSGELREVPTDARGAFAIDRVDPGRYCVVA